MRPVTPHSRQGCRSTCTAESAVILSVLQQVARMSECNMHVFAATALNLPLQNLSR
jgi:hypothetical protein